MGHLNPHLLLPIAVLLVGIDPTESLRTELLGQWDLEEYRISEQLVSLDPYSLEITESSLIAVTEDQRTTYCYEIDLSVEPVAFSVWECNAGQLIKDVDREPPLVHGILRIEGDKLVRCFTRGDQERPDSFRDAGEPGVSRTVHKRRTVSEDCTASR